METILLLDSRADELRTQLSAKTSTLTYRTLHDGDEAIAGCDIWLGEPDLAVPLLAAGHQPGWLQSTWAGFKPLLATHLPHNYRLSRAVGVFGQPIAEYVLAHILSHEQRLPALYAQQQQACWDRRLPGQLAGKTVLIVGAGEIGCEVAALLRPFGVVLRAIVNTPRALPEFSAVSGLELLVPEVAIADYVINLLPDTVRTQNVYDAALFAHMKPSAALINVGRGTAVVDADLVAALQAGKLAWAVLDVFRQEPLPTHHTFWGVENLTITPHIAGPMVPALMAELFLANSSRYRQGEPLRGEVDFAQEY